MLLRQTGLPIQGVKSDLICEQLNVSDVPIWSQLPSIHRVTKRWH